MRQEANIASGNGLLPVWFQATMQTNAYLYCPPTETHAVKIAFSNNYQQCNKKGFAYRRRKLTKHKDNHSVVNTYMCFTIWCLRCF